MIRSLIQPALWLVWHAHMHNSLTHRSHNPSNPQEEFLLQNTQVNLETLHFIRVVSLPFYTTQHNTTSPKIERKRKNLWHFNLVPCSLQRTWTVFILFTFKNIKLKWMSSNKTIKLLLQRCKNCSEMKASFLFNILETIADNLSALIEFTPI